MAYNLNPNQPYGRPAYAVQPKPGMRAPAFGHNASASAFGAPASLYQIPSPALPPMANPAPMMNASMQRSLGYPVQNFRPVTPSPVSGVPGRALPPMPAAMAPLVNQAQSGKPTVQNYYYPAPAKAPPSKKKDLKKFLFTTGAVMAGMFTTAGILVGALCFFAPQHTKFFKDLGAKPFSWANQGLKAFKNTEGSLVRKVISSGKAVNGAIKEKPVAQRSPYAKTKLWILELFNSDAAERYARELEKAEASSNIRINQPLLKQGDIAELAKGLGEEDIQAVADVSKKFLSKAGVNLENQSLGNILAEVVNKLEPDKLTKLITGVVPEEKLKAITKDGTEKLTDKEIIDKYILNMLSEVMDDALRSKTFRDYADAKVREVTSWKYWRPWGS